MWKTNFEEAKEESQKSRNPIFLQFEMDSCGGCEKLEKETYPDENVKAELEEWFVPLRLDLKKDREIRRELSGYWTPSFYFLDHNGKSYYNFNGYLPPDEFRLMLRIGFSEAMIPKGKYDEVIEVTGKKIDSFEGSVLLPKVLVQKGIASYIKSKDNDTFRKTMKEIQEKYPKSLEAKMYFWNE